MKRLFVCLLAACGSEVTSSSDPVEDVLDERDPDASACLAPCVDDDPCTDTFCDESSGQCRVVPRDVRNACRTNEHCDDGDGCTRDACNVDDCGLERCMHWPREGCHSCDSQRDCMPDAPCTVARCEDKACVMHAVTDCEARCSRLGGGEVLFGPVATPTCTCPCEAPLALAGEYSNYRLAFGEPEGSCLMDCDGGLACSPLDAEREWILFGHSTQLPVSLGHYVDGFVVKGWCLAPHTLYIDPPHRGRFIVPGQPDQTFTLVGDGRTELGLVPDRCDACTITVLADPDIRGDQRIEWHIAKLRVNEERVGVQDVQAYLFPTATTLQGPVYPADLVTREPFGTLVFEFD